MTQPTLHRGKIAKAPKILAVRPLTREDLACLKTTDRVAARVKGFRDTHHRLARLCAAGLRNEEILRITGFSLLRLSTLKMDPAFQELIAQYRGRVDEAFVASQDEFYETSTSNMLRAERQIEEHLDRADGDGELLPVKTLLAITSDRADRFGYSKKTVNTNINIDFAKRLEQMAARQGKATTIDARTSHALVSSPQGSGVPSPSPEDSQFVAASSGFRRRM